MAPNAKVQFGHPDFWPKALDAFPKFFEVAGRAGDALNNLVMRGYKEVEPIQKVILNLGILTGISMMELVTLAGNGFGLGAMKIARTILESAINAEYLRRFPDECEDYLNWHRVEVYKDLMYLRQHNPDRLKDLSPETIARIEQDYEQVKARFQRDGQERLRGSWCSLDLGSRAARTDFAEAYRVINPIASQLIHGSIGGLAKHFDVEEDEHRIAVPPSLNYCGEALIGGHMCLVKQVETVSLTFNAELRYPIARLVEEFHYAWGV